VLERVAATRAWLKGRVERGLAQGLYDEVLDALEAQQACFAGSDAAQEAATKAAELKADPKVKEELKAAKALAKLQEEKAKAGNRAGKLDDLAKQVERFIEKHEGLKAAERAKRLLRQIKDAPRR
jgi:hypothetical protein